jgi:hypothetical protein
MFKLNNLQMYLGYCITGQMNETKIFGIKDPFAYDLIEDIMISILDNYTTCGEFNVKHFANNPLKLYRRRLCMMGELFNRANINDNINIPKILEYFTIGAKNINMRELYCEAITFDSFCKGIFIASDHSINNINIFINSINSRYKKNIVKIEYLDIQYKKEQYDIYNDFVKNNINEVFSWIVKGSILWYCNNLPTNPKSNINSNYIGSMPTIEI